MEAEGFRGAARECDHMAFHDLPPARLAQQVAEPCINLESSYQSQRPLAWLALLRFSDQERANGRRHAIPEPGLWRGSLAQPDRISGYGGATDTLGRPKEKKRI